MSKIFDATTNFHGTILKKKNIKKSNKIFLKLDALPFPFPFTMLCHLFLAFFYQLLLDQTHSKPTAKYRIASHRI